jgi:hypothetical protein
LAITGKIMAIIGPLPNILQDGTPADAVPVMADFNWIVAQVNLNAVNSTALLPYALLNNPAFTGTPTAPTAAVNDNSTQLATDAFVNTQIAADLAAYAPLASPHFGGAPTAPTQAFGVYNTDIATTAFVENFGIGTISGGYRNVTGSRSVGTTFTNTASAPLTVSIVVLVNSLESLVLFIGGADVYQQDNRTTGTVFSTVVHIIPPGATYAVQAAGVLLVNWYEW